jgi:proteasome lid subunit RPN8/RPN11
MRELQLPQHVYRQLRQHGEDAYPHEGCGVLVGVSNDGARQIIAAVPARNISTTPANHYEIAPRDLIRIERESRLANLEIAGFYHSHPNHPAHWSQTDLAEAHWLGCSYVITEIREGAAVATRSFYLAGAGEEDKHFEPEQIQVGES